MTAQRQLIIFDCDGVLVDTERISVGIDVAVLSELGWLMTETEVIERFLGRSDEDMRSEIEAHLGRPLPDDWERSVEHRYRQAFETELTAVDGFSRRSIASLPPPAWRPAAASRRSGSPWSSSAFTVDSMVGSSASPR